MVTSLPSSIAALLRERTAAAGHRPLLTFVTATHDERTELSYATFANWVGKSANLLSEEFAVGPGDRVALALPTSWTTAVLTMACWTLRACVVLDGAGPEVDRLRVVVTGEGTGVAPGWPRDLGRMVVGDGMAGRLLGPGVAGALPYGEEVLAHADDPEDTGPGLDDDALLMSAAGDAEPLRLAQRALLTAAGTIGLAAAGRLLSTLPLDRPDGLALGLLGPLLAGGAVVLAAGAPAAQALTRLAGEERVGTLLTDAAGVAALAASGDVGGLTRILCPGGAPPEAVRAAEEAGAGVLLDLPGAPGWVGLRDDPGVDGPQSRAGS